MSFLNFTILDILDILLAAFLLYQLYRIVKGTAAIRIFIGIAAIYIAWKVVDALHMEVLTEMLGQFIGVGFLLLVIVFQQEIRRFLLMIGTATFRRRRRFIKQFSFLRNSSGNEDNGLTLDPIVLACQNLSERHEGALIVLTQHTPLSNYAQTGIMLDARISSNLIESIFQKNGPLHDGAVIVLNNRIESAGAILPVSDGTHVPSRFGLRHRAALGISEKSDAICIVVSEETGKVALTYNSRIEQLEIGELKSRVSRIMDRN